MTTFEEISKILDSLIPEHLAEDWDNPGPQLGELDTPINTILLSLDINFPVLQEALNTNSQMILTHHPLFFRPISRLINDTKKTSLIFQLIKNNICVFSLHTNLDILFYKKLPSLFDIKDIQPLKPVEFKSDILGLGSFGVLSQQISLRELSFRVSKKLHTQQVKMVGNGDKMVQTIAFCGGTGTSFIQKKYKDLGIDVLITSDIKYHDAQKAEDLDLCLIDAGHFFTENIMMKELKEFLSDKLQVKLVLSEIDTNPFLDTKEV